jgi:ubiquinol-cytochrome c reductase cytochrome b subunit
MLRATTDLMVNVLRRRRARRGAGIVRGGFGAMGKVASRSRRSSRCAAQDLRRQVLGRGRDGRRGHHPVLPALARPQPGQVDPLPPDWHKYLYGVFVFFFLVLGYLGSQPPSATGNSCRRSARWCTSASSC